MTADSIVDSHHHLWDTGRLRYPLFDDVPALRRPFLLTEFATVAARSRVTAAVCVEAASAGADGLAEARWLLEHTRHSGPVTRLVVWAPIERPDLPDYLDRVSEFDTNGRVVGVRRSFEFEPAEFPRRDGVIRGAKEAAARGLVVDLVLFHPSLPAALELVHACPETQFVLDHLGKPPVRQRLEHPWRELIAEMAACPNVVTKVSGLITEADRRSWTVEDLRPYVDHAIMSFGWDRVLFGSDWPVCLLAGTYERWLGALQEIVAPAPAGDQARLFNANARRIYRLDGATGSL